MSKKRLFIDMTRVHVYRVYMISPYVEKVQKFKRVASQDYRVDHAVQTSTNNLHFSSLNSPASTLTP